MSSAGDASPLLPDADGGGKKASTLSTPVQVAMAVGGVLAVACIGFFVPVISIITFWNFKADYSPGCPAHCTELPVMPEGYPEITLHEVETADGVTMKMWNLPQDGPPVIIQHGLECSARDFFTGLDTECLPYKLWDAGYDVWLGNSRGNFFAETPSFNWTFMEMAEFDVPATVNAVVNFTGRPKVAWIGHSQGALSAFMHFSHSSETASKIAYFVGLAPSIWMSQKVLTWNILSGFYVDDLVSVATAKHGSDFETYEEMKRDSCFTVNFLGLCPHICGKDMGGDFMEGDKGWEPHCYDKFACIPAGTSSDNVRAFADSLRLGSFQSYLKLHGKEINFHHLHMPISLAIGESDKFMSVENIEQIKSECKDGVVKDLWTLPGAGHMDLVWGKESPEKIYEPLIARLGEYLPVEHADD